MSIDVPVPHAADVMHYYPLYGDPADDVGVFWKTMAIIT